jgi:hypothetical protein
MNPLDEILSDPVSRAALKSGGRVLWLTDDRRLIVVAGWPARVERIVEVPA